MSFVIIVIFCLILFVESKICCIFAGNKRINHERMNSKLLKLNEPYKVIYAGGKVGRHIATLFTWEEDEDGSAEILESHEYPIIDQGEEFPAGTLVTTEIEDCRVICGYNPKNGITGTNLYWLAGIIEYDFQQLEPSGAEYILKRLELLDCQIKLPEEEVKDEDGKPELDENGKKVMTTKWDYTASLWVSLKKGRFEGEREYIVKGNHSNGFYFESMGTADETTCSTASAASISARVTAIWPTCSTA